MQRVASQIYAQVPEPTRVTANSPAGDPMQPGRPQPIGSSRNAALAEFFVHMRAVSGLPTIMVAARLGTHELVVQALEYGDVSALPPPPELAHIIRSYGRMVGIDASPALARIEHLRAGTAPNGRQASNGTHATAQQSAPSAGWYQPAAPMGAPMASPGPAVQPSPARPPAYAAPPTPNTAQHYQAMGPAQMAPAAPYPYPTAAPMRPTHAPAQMPPAYMAPPPPPPYAAGAALSAINPLQPPQDAPSYAPADEGMPEPADLPGALKTRAGRGGKQHAARSAFKYVTVPMILLAGLWYTIQHPTQVHAALGQLPEPLPRIALAGMELVLVGTSPTKDGLRMISTGDPRSRKGDKLQVRRATNDK